jgi:hypothetical protein
MFFILSLLEARAKKCTKSRWFFGVWENLVFCFRDLLIFGFKKKSQTNLPNGPNGPTQPKCQIMFHKKSPPQDLIRGTFFAKHAMYIVAVLVILFQGFIEIFPLFLNNILTQEINLSCFTSRPLDT